MKRSCGSLAVGEMCRIMDGYLGGEVDYRGRNEHVDFLLDCLRRRSRRRWDARDLRGVTDFLMSAAMLKRRSAAKSSRRHADPDGVMKLLAKYATKARKAFSDNVYFQLLAGETEMHKGPRKCRRKFARTCFQRAVELGGAAGDEASMALAKRAKEKLLFLDAHAYRPPDDVFSLPPPEDDFAAEMDDLFAEMDPEGEGFSPGEAGGSLFAMFARVCREQGLDPKDVLDGMSGGDAVPLPAAKPAQALAKERKIGRRMSDPYATLGLSAGCGEGDVRRRYLELVRQHPPDRAPERFAEIHDAYEKLRDPVLRMESALFDLDSLGTIVETIADVRRRLRTSRIPTQTLLSLAEAR